MVNDNDVLPSWSLQSGKGSIINSELELRIVKRVMKERNEKSPR